MMFAFSSSGLGGQARDQARDQASSGRRAAQAIPVPRLVPVVRPFFDFVCEARIQIDRGSGAFGVMTAEQLTDRIDQEIDQIRQRKNVAPELASLIRDEDTLLEDLRAFATYTLAQGSTETSRQVNFIRRRRGPVQDESFTDHLRAELKAMNPGTAERLVVYSMCLGLGYQGVEEEQTIRKLRAEVWGHVQRIVPDPRKDHPKAPGVKPLFPDAYDINTEKLHTPPVRWWIVYLASAIALASIVVAVVAVRSVGRERDNAIDLLLEQRAENPGAGAGTDANSGK